MTTDILWNNIQKISNIDANYTCLDTINALLNDFSLGTSSLSSNLSSEAPRKYVAYPGVMDKYGLLLHGQSKCVFCDALLGVRRLTKKM